MKTPAWACLAAVFFLAPAAQAQFDLFLVEGTVERPAPAVYDFGVLYANESVTAHFRLRNTSGAAATLNSLAVAGAGFTLTAPTLPVGLAPQQAIDLSVAFRTADTGAYSASLHSEGTGILLIATVAPRLTYRVDSGAGVEFPASLDFGSVVRGGFAERRIAFRNDTPGVLIVPAISVQGVDFALDGAPPSGQAIAPGQGGEFKLVFTPQAIGIRQGSITLGDRNYPLLGTGAGPPLPAPTVTLDLKQAASAQQGTMIVRFDAPAQTSGSGTATLDFQGPADSAIGFAAGGRSVTFPIAPGDLQAVLPSKRARVPGFSPSLHAWAERATGRASRSPAVPQQSRPFREDARRALWRSILQALTTHAPWERCRLRFTMPPASRSRRGRYEQTPPRTLPATSQAQTLAAYLCCAPCFRLPAMPE